ncbi:MAG: glutathione S-transferase [Solimicrobium sp.]|jgi:glutathione S-transferase|nr:glutathione S-transferase [Solimicrobium sp.]
MKLIGSTASPFVRKVRIFLAEKKLECDLILEDVWSPDTIIQDLNPLGKVPCLVMEDNSCVFDSHVIVEYLDTLTPVSKLIPSHGRERAAVKCWEALADGILDAAILVRLELTKRPPELQSKDWISRQMNKVHLGLRSMSTGLSESAFCNGTHYSLADVCVGCVLGWLSFRFPELNWQTDYPNLAKLFEKLSERSTFKETVPH